MSLDLQSNEPNVAVYPSNTFVISDVADASAVSWARPQISGPEEHFSYRVVKRAVDVAVVLFLCILLSPVLVVIAAAVWATSPGPVLFSHRRIRRHGEFFTMWKFRTMCTNSGEVLERYLMAHPDARAEWRATHKLRCDPRVTRVGRFLRRTSLDELPQLWNVLNGSMSLVGPRPIVAAEVEKYGEFFCDYCTVKPGVTGLWQVSGRSELTYPQRVELDRQYAQNWSLGADAKILMRTCSCVVNRDGAY
jgi:Undecaprenyl-phosphate galactose phosphotransferase WbaP